MKAQTRVQATVKPPLKSAQDERTRIHRAINWVVSVILIAFAFWSINLNAEGRSFLKQATAIIAETDHKIEAVQASMEIIKKLCQPTTIVVPTTPVDTIE